MMNDLLVRACKRLLPAGLVKRLSTNASVAAAHVEHQRLERFDFSLTPRHVANTRVYSSRHELLGTFSKGAVIAEAGVSQGQYSRAILEVCQPQKLHLIDIWQSNKARYDEEAYQLVLKTFASQIGSGTVVVHRDYSHKVFAAFPDNYLDYVYLDADHSYDAVKLELETVKQKMKPDGVIAGHDYVKWSNQSSRFGVVEAVNEFCLNHDFELIGLTVQRNMHLSFAIRKFR
ncbi:MAG: class I SAM-dependent methyltransferase [Planctomycetaceae bacterium]